MKNCRPECRFVFELLLQPDKRFTPLPILWGAEISLFSTHTIGQKVQSTSQAIRDTIPAAAQAHAPSSGRNAHPSEPAGPDSRPPPPSCSHCSAHLPSLLMQAATRKKMEQCVQYWQPHFKQGKLQKRASKMIRWVWHLHEEKL